MWKKIAPFILRNRLPLLLGLLAVVLLLALQIESKFSKTAAQLLPSDSKEMQDFQNFVAAFGQEDNLLTIGLKGDRITEPANFQAWQKLTNRIKNLRGVIQVISLDDVQKLEKDTANQRFTMVPIVPTIRNEKDWLSLTQEIKKYPFYKNILYNTTSKAMQSAIYLQPQIVNSERREEVVLQIDSWVREFEEKSGIDVHLSGMPVIRTFNTIEVKKESTQFILLSMLVTSLIFLAFFRSFRATFVALLVVAFAVLISFASLSLLRFEITILTALVPPLLIVIGIPNCIFLINKYQKEFATHRNKVLALYRTIVKVGSPALLTNCTTAFGFFTFIFTDSDTLREFGIIASINILGIFVLSFLIIPILYSYFPEPKARHLKHQEKKWLKFIFDKMKNWVLYKRKFIYAFSFAALIFGGIGIYLMKSSGNLLDDMSKNADFYRDISFFDQEFGGVLPLEIMIDTQRSKGATQLSTLRRIDALNQYIDSMGMSSQPISTVRLVKFAKQAFYNNDSSFYALPSNQEKNFILGYVKNSQGEGDMLKNYMDESQSKTRVTTLLKNVESEKMESLVADIQGKMLELFPAENYHSYVTGGAYLFMRGTDFLTKNLLISLTLAILLIAAFMAIMFRSGAMIFVALVPNFLPLIFTAGAMGVFGIGLKPSTILVFSIAFGIAVDDTIHFLARYRQSLKYNKGNVKPAVLDAIDETGTSMFYTSIVLFAGFATFTFSGFEGIVALGGLVAVTLIIAMVSNLVLLPSLLLSYANLTNKSVVEPGEDDFFYDEDDLDIDLENLKLER